MVENTLTHAHTWSQMFLGIRMHCCISCLIDLKVGQVSKHETELQLLRRLKESYTSIARGRGASEPPPAFADIAAQIMKSKPPHAGTLPMLYKFLLRFSGGDDQWLLQQTESFVLNHGRPGKSLGEDMWEALSMEVKGRPSVIFRHGLLKACYVSGSKLISQTDIKRALTSKNLQNEIQEYEKCLAKLRSKAPEKMSKLQVNMQIGQFEISAVLSMLQTLLVLFRFRA